MFRQVKQYNLNAKQLAGVLSI